MTYKYQNPNSLLPLPQLPPPPAHPPSRLRRLAGSLPRRVPPSLMDSTRQARRLPDAASPNRQAPTRPPPLPPSILAAPGTPAADRHRCDGASRDRSRPAGLSPRQDLPRAGGIYYTAPRRTAGGQRDLHRQRGALAVAPPSRPFLLRRRGGAAGVTSAGQWHRPLLPRRRVGA
jgi:hypothetical protein